MLQEFCFPHGDWNYSLEDGVNDWVKGGRIELLERRLTQNYYPGKNGLFYVMKKL